jgi:VanZ family protein
LSVGGARRYDAESEKVRRLRGSSGRRSWVSAWVPFGLWVLVIIGLSSIPDLGPPRIGLPLMDKLCHVGEYGVLGLLWGRARGARALAPSLAAGALVGLGLGSADEIYQVGVPGRDSSLFDVAADVVGAALGAAVWSWRRRDR